MVNTERNHTMGLIQLYSTTKTSASNDDLSGSSSYQTENVAFCNCLEQYQRQQYQSQLMPLPEVPATHLSTHLSTVSNDTVDKNYLNKKKETISAQIPLDTCRCGEDACKTFNWTWDRECIQPQTIIDNHTIKFHPYYSQGTSVIRSNVPLANNMIHYWEIKIVHWFTGTDLVSLSCVFYLYLLL